jgi:co-chaperonin GroES (HSP10)
MKANQIKPLKDRVLVKPDGMEEFIGSLQVPEEYRKKLQRGTVLALGKKCKREELRVGDEVAFAAYGGHKIQTEDQGQVELFDNNLVWVNFNLK